MHRHGYKGRKFGRETDQRQALIRGLMCSLIQYQSITTTLAKAKEMRRYMEKLITLAKKGDLASRRLIIARLNSQAMGSLLVDSVAPQVKRDSGYLRIVRAGLRKGDNTEMATISFVDDIKIATPIVKDGKEQPEPTASPAPRAMRKTAGLSHERSENKEEKK